jgi:hypothetical protein
VFKEWSSNGGEKIIGNTTNLTSFFGKGDGFGYVDLSADLSAMQSPNQYKVVFYAEEENEETGMDWVMDSTNWIPIPTPKLDILTSPTSIVLRPEEDGFIQIFALLHDSLCFN